MREQRASHRDGGPNAEHHNKDYRLIVRVLEGSVPPARSLKHLHADAESQQRGGEQLADVRAHDANHSTLKTDGVSDALNFDQCGSIGSEAPDGAARERCPRAFRRPLETFRPLDHADRAQNSQFLDLFAEESWRMFVRVNSKCAHQVRPPFGPRTRPGAEERGR
jgi:hypothetical protein